ncbi:NimA-related protein kinase 7 [Volvox carteri f. nagariensis]|uniref:non-specific serine/threonine protein kinase n=1 Tax=Volvox carteri f. nagariensis TaxID=3068 RepID=D8TN62_VOLCA|nr:NimA-related protein kinase 7 [Volvox carteri f. nagariensis]EFJ50934.1 NimA-related protein kinase 7 [Volvox carteri f. nagariensis]|eukprot:XP_002947946.1 NimA-related protein kinase 7 [Volvox carteri f. nagariensis]
MPPQNSFTIKQNTPEADKLERRVHAELKEIWDPSADATVAKYLTAMLTKGYDRKKIHSQLKAILQEPVTVQLLDWYVIVGYKLHRPCLAQSVRAEPLCLTAGFTSIFAFMAQRSECNSYPRSSKQAPKPLPSVAKVVPMEESHEHDRGDTGRDGSSEPAGQAAQVTHAGKVTGVDAQLSEKPERSRRRQPGASSQAAATPGELRHPSETQLPKQQQRQVEEQQQAKEQQEQFSAAAERRRLKSSVVLDWESWQKQKQPADEQRATKSSAPAGNLAAPERAPIMPHSNQDTADHPLRIPASHRGREDGRERERDRGREREGERGGGPGRRRHESEAERPASRHRDGDGDTSALRGHERESDGVRQKGGAPAHRSRSRSRSRSPRGRRPGHAPLVTANLLRSALGGLGGPGARGSKASVFERLGASGAAPEAAPARVSALQRLEGSDKVDRAMDTSGSGRKRGPEGEADADAAILGSPPKTARGINAQKPSGPLRAAAEPPPAPALRAGPASGRPRVEFAPATAPVGVTKQPAGPPKQDPVKVTSASDQATIEGVGIRPVAGVSVAGGVKGPGAGGTGAATIMPTSMSGVVIEAQLDADLRSVVVTNVHFLASQEVLAAHFSVVGPVKNVTIMRDKVTGRPTGVAVVEMATEQATQAAAALSGSLLMDLPIVVTLKAALLLQGINLAGMGIDSAGVRMPVLMPPLGSAANIAPAGRLNPSAVPFVPGLPASAPAPADARLAGGPSGAVGGIPLDRLLGRGKYSQVYLAKDIRTGELVAIKRVEIFDMMDQASRQACVKEVKILQNVEHPHIVKCFRSFLSNENNELVIVLEWAEGGDLGHVIKQRQEMGQAFSPEQVWVQFQQVCGALKHMHDRRMMHRDLKPSNIFVTASGDLKLGDLGLSRYFSSRTLQAQTTVGTPYYMSPEVVRGQPYDFSSDIWSLGCLLYELIALRNPFYKENQSLYVLGKLIQNCQYEALPPSVPDELRQLVSSMLQPLPQSRPTIAQLAAYVNSYLAQKLPHTQQHLQQHRSGVRGPPPRWREEGPGAGAAAAAQDALAQTAEPNKIMLLLCSLGV